MRQEVLMAVAASVPVGAIGGGLLWIDAKSREWSRLPLWLFVLAGTVLFALTILFLIKFVAGGFG
jgi:hypothetical protein